MIFRDIPIQRKLIAVNLLTSGIVLILTWIAFFAYEYHNFRQTILGEVSSLGNIIAANSTAALAFDDQETAKEILTALENEVNIEGAVLYDTAGLIFAQYPDNFSKEILRQKPQAEDYQFKSSYLEGYEPVIQGSVRLGTLYLKSNLKGMDERLQLYGLIALGAISIAFLLAYLLSVLFQRTVSGPILRLAETARAVSERKDYSVRAVKAGKDELGVLTDAFNHMLARIQEQSLGLSLFNQKLAQKVSERTAELEKAIKEQKEAERATYEANKELSQALEELRSTEEQLIELNNELERRVDERTNELLESQAALKVKNEELEKINVDLDNFIYTASHDLKSPIVNLEGLTIWMRKKLDPAAHGEFKELLDMVDTSVQKLKKTIVDLTEITKAQKDLSEDEARLSLPELLEDIKEDIKQSIQESGAQLKVKMDVKELVFPRNNLRSILYNLLSNAIKYRSPDRVPEIQLSTYRVNGSVVLSVQDNGLGLSEAQQNKLFTMFKRFHSHVDGTGIGLYIIKRVIENRGGKIEVESNPQEGSTFKVYIPQPEK